MKYSALSAILLISHIYLYGCSNEAWYKGATTSHEIKCLQQSSSDYDACKNDNLHTYDEYKQAKEELNKGDNQ